MASRMKRKPTLIRVDHEKDLFLTNAFLNPVMPDNKLNRSVSDSRFLIKSKGNHHEPVRNNYDGNPNDFKVLAKKTKSVSDVGDLANVEIKESFGYGVMKGSTLKRSTTVSNVYVRPKAHASLGRNSQSSDLYVSGSQLKKKLVSIQGAVAAFILVLHTTFPPIKTFRIDFWVTKPDGTVVGSKIAIPVRDSAPLMQLISHINFSLGDAGLLDTKLVGCSLTLQWSEEGNNFVQKYPLPLLSPKENFLRFEFSDFYHGSTWDNVTIRFQKGTVCDQAPDSPLPDFLGHIKFVFSSFSKSPLVYVNVGDIKVIPPAENDLLQLRFSNLDTFKPLPLLQGKQPYLATIFTDIAKRYPNRPALVASDITWSYAQLLQVSRLIATILVNDYGVGPNDHVMLMLPRDKAGSFACMLGVLLAGAAYVPVDNEKSPIDRSAYIIEDCDCKVALVPSDEIKEQIKDAFSAPNDCAVLTASSLVEKLRYCSYVFDERKIKRSPTDHAYIIYTSGTTGKPKGVVVMQHNVANLALCEKELFQLTPEDRVYQNFSHSFDFSIEELWQAWSSGAALIAPTQEMLIAGPDLPQYLEAAGVTVFNCVPTHLSILARDIEGVKMIVLGGEAAQELVIERFRRPGRKIYNTYGPTEATCSCTYLDCSDPVEQMTIGKSLPGYTSYIVDPDTGKLLPHGATGELIVGGEGVTKGYLKRPDLTADKFYPNTFVQKMPHWSNAKGYPTNARLYKSGDLCRYTFDGRIEYFGRIDCQVKLRGFRVELGEIEAVLMLCENINTAICHVWTDDGVQTLCAYLVLDDPSLEFSEVEIRDKIGEKLATYMIPSVFVLLSANEVPRLPSGKVDRKKLVKPEFEVEKDEFDEEELANLGGDGSIESSILAIWKKAFGNPEITPDDHFFRDLAGHSLLAARIISAMRQNPLLNSIGVKDLYVYPTVGTMAAYLEKKNGVSAKGKQESQVPPEVAEFRALPYLFPGYKYYVCSFFQMLSLYFIFFASSIPLLSAVMAGVLFLDSFEVYFDEGLPWEIVFALLMLIGFYVGRFIQLFFCIFLKRTVIGRYKVGTFPLYGFYYFRWWFISNMMGTISFADFHGSPALNFFYWLLGANIGSNVHIGTSSLDCLDLLTIKDGASIGFDCTIHGYEIRNGYIRFARTVVGKNVTVHAHSFISPGTILNDECTLEELTHVPTGVIIPEGETWGGSPAVKITDERSQASTDVFVASFGRKFLFYFGMFWAWLITYAFNLLLIGPFFVAGYVLIVYSPFELGWWWPIIIVIPATTLGVLTFLFLSLVLKWVFVGKMKAGTVPIYSFYYIRLWMFDSMFTGALVSLHTFFATIYLPPWLRLLGAKIGKDTELTFFSPMNCELMTLDDGVFVADGCVTAPHRYSRGYMTTGTLHVGDRSFLGNQSVVHMNTEVETDALLGVDSVPPFRKGQHIIKQGETWLGNPPIEIPQREVLNETYDTNKTFKPTTLMVLGRLVWEYFRIIIPICITNLIAFGEFLFLVIPAPTLPFEWWEKVLLFPFIVAGYFFVVALIIISLKWIFMGVYKPIKAPLYSSFVRRTELTTGIQEQLAGTTFLPIIRGTPLLGLFFKSMGTKIGKGVYWDSFDITEHDLVHVGDYTTISANVTLQSHLFEDRVMKCGPIDIGSYCNIGTRTTVLYDTVIADNVDILPVSLVMKGEEVQSGVWVGQPLEQAPI